jgi:hypothetical protein
MFEILDWVEHTGLSLWVREDPSLAAFPLMLILHTVGMAFLVGSNVALNARILGLGRGMSLTSMLPFYRVMWLGFWLNAFSGSALLIAYPTKALTNPVFYLKLTLIAVGLVQAQWIRRHILQDPQLGDDWAPRPLRLRATLSLVCWLSAVTAGKLLPYTYHHLRAYEGLGG